MESLLALPAREALDPRPRLTARPATFGQHFLNSAAVWLALMAAWTLADLLGRPMGHIMEARGPGFTIFPAERAHHVMGEIPFGPFASLDDALRAVEKRTHGLCRCAPDQT